jgi:hypothetical protein
LLSHKYFKLSLLLAALLWLVLKSPITFYSLLERSGSAQSNPSEIYYFYIEFFSWLLLSIPVSIYIFSKSDFKTFVDQHRVLIFIFLNFFYTLFRTFKTFDVTDTGFHFTKAWGLFHNSTAQNIDFFVGTSFINGLWLLIAGTPNVLWARFGYVILVTGTSIVSYKIFSLYFNRLIDWFVFLILSLFFIHFNYYLSINYDNLPVFSALTGIWFLLKKDKTWISYTLSGIFLSLTIWLKFNFILIIFLPVIYGWILYENKGEWLKKTLFIYSGYLISLLLGGILLISSAHFDTYTDYIDKNLINRKNSQTSYGKKIEELLKQEKFSDSVESQNSEDKFFFLTDSMKNTSERKEPGYSQDFDSYGLIQLFNSYFVGFWTVLQKGAHFLIFLSILLFLLGNTRRLKNYPVIFLFSFMFYYITYWNVEGNDFIFLSSLIVPAYIYLIFYLRYNEEFIEPTVLILLIALFSFPGSNLSFNVIYRSGAALLMLSFPLAFMINKTINVNKQILNLNNYVIIFMLTVSLGIIKPWGYNNSHRDIGDRSVLVEMFKSPQLFGIHTFPQRAEVIDEVLDYFKKEDYKRNNTPALFLGWIPTMYYLTETNCITNNPWHGCVLFDEFKDEYDQNSKNQAPVYITFSKIMTRNPSWPLMDEEYRKQDKAWLPDLRKFDYIRYWMKDKNYNKTFENEMFEVYKMVNEFPVGP